ncbi:MAG: cytochrome P450 [Acidimicrobiia bacterium]
MILEFCRHPDQYDAVRARPELVPNAIEETLRYRSPVQGFFRNTLAPFERHGVTIPAGAKVMLLHGSANHDPTLLPDPERFDVTREPSVHLAVGTGIHMCLGAPPAPLEATVLLRRLVGRVARFEPAGEPVRPHNPLLRGVAHVPVTVTPAQRARRSLGGRRRAEDGNPPPSTLPRVDPARAGRRRAVAQLG